MLWSHHMLLDCWDTAAPDSTTSKNQVTPGLQLLRTHLVDGLLGGLVGLVVHKAVALRLAGGVQGDLARQDVAEGGEGVVQRLVVDVLVQVLRTDARHTSNTCAYSSCSTVHPTISSQHPAAPA
jgi:hypothetical protein